ncbi:hypothetical protein B0H15DRAFT_954951 [Mycena belliarum]|uniref:Uncharacterized protein n=1 Tax=Mycena belliarum TaxID=1033014 RepID=A0AAD6TX78_9AGAR|nr:hypothetical protein B0H15DRAFT_954951 [Mycena belliae]
MAPKPWATAAQRAFLELQMPDYIRRQAQKKLHLFWGSMEEAWFARYPEQEVLGLPLACDTTAAPLTDVQRAVLGEAIEGRKAQLASWYRRERKKIRQGGGGGSKSKKISPLMKAFAKKTSSAGRRAPQPKEVFQKLHKDEIRAELSQRGHDAMNEAVRVQGRETEETLEEQEVAVKMSRSERMRLRTQVVAEMWKNASEERLEEVRERVSLEKRKLEEERRKERESGDGERTATQYQEGIDAIDELFEEAHSVSLRLAGWVGFTVVGGPTPRLPGGEQTVKVICSGETIAGNNFTQACADFEQAILKPFKLFLDRVYTPTVCLEREIKQGIDEPSV